MPSHSPLGLFAEFCHGHTFPNASQILDSCSANSFTSIEFERSVVVVLKWVCVWIGSPVLLLQESNLFQAACQNFLAVRLKMPSLAASVAESVVLINISRDWRRANACSMPISPTSKASPNSDSVPGLPPYYRLRISMGPSLSMPRQILC